jgi:hypothetical protein
MDIEMNKHPIPAILGLSALLGRFNASVQNI